MTTAAAYLQQHTFSTSCSESSQSLYGTRVSMETTSDTAGTEKRHFSDWLVCLWSSPLDGRLEHQRAAVVSLT